MERRDALIVHPLVPAIAFLRRHGQDLDDEHHLDWSADGRWIAQERGTDVWIVDAENGKARPFITSTAVERFPRISPDGRWLAYTSNESGRYEIYVQRFPEGSGKWQISTRGGEGVRWRGDGKELFYFNAGEIFAVPIEVRDGRLASGVPQTLFTVASLNSHSWDVTADGQRFLIPVAAETASTQIKVFSNWQTALQK